MNKLIYTLSLLTFVTVSCNKDDGDYLETGKTKGMTVTSHNLSEKADFGEENRRKTIELDLDGNGHMDIQFISFKDSVMPQPCGTYSEEELNEMEFEGTKFMQSYINLKIIDESFEFAIYENSNVVYEIYSDEYEVEHPDGIAYMHDVTMTKNKPETYNQTWDSGGTLRSFTKSELVSENQMFLSNPFMATIRENSFEYSYSSVDDFGTRRGAIVFKDEEPNEVPVNQERYLVFKQLNKWGWISFEVTEENRITIFESAISKR